MSTKRRDAATATVGAGGVVGGSFLRTSAVNDLIRAQGGKEPKVHGLAVMRRGNKAMRRKWGGGAALGTLGAVPLAVGATRFARGDVNKREKPSFLQEGLKGTGEALGMKAENAVDREVPTKARAAGLATTATAAGLGAVAARAAMRGKGPWTKAAVAPVAGVLTGAAATPLSSRVTDRVSPGYEVTSTGVRRKKKALKKPSSASYTHHNIPRSFQADIGKAMSDEEYEMEAESLHIDLKQLYYADKDKDTKRKKYWANQVLLAAKEYEEQGEYDLAEDALEALANVMPASWYRKHAAGASRQLIEDTKPREYKRDALGRFSKSMSSGEYRARITGAGAVPIPVFQHVNAARTAARYGNPDKKGRTAATQFAAGAGGEVGGAALGAYGATAAARRYTGFGNKAAQASDAIDRKKAAVSNQVNRVPGMKRTRDTVRSGIGNLKPAGAGNGRAGKMVRSAMKPLKANPKVAAVGALGGQMVVGNLSTQSAITANNRRRVAKSVATTGMTRTDRQKQAKKKRFQATLNYGGGALGLTGLGLLAASKSPRMAAKLKKTPEQLKSMSTSSTTMGAGIGGLAALNFAGVMRREAAAESKIKKSRGRLVAKGMPDQAALHVPGAAKKPRGKLIPLKVGAR